MNIASQDQSIISTLDGNSMYQGLNIFQCNHKTHIPDVDLGAGLS